MTDPILDPIPSKHAMRRAGLRLDGDFEAKKLRALLIRIQQNRRKLRVIWPEEAIPKSPGLIFRLQHAVCPWSVTDYPGKTVLLAWITGLKADTVIRYRSGNQIPHEAAQRAAGWLEGKAAEYLALAGELRAIPPGQKGFPKGYKRKKPDGESG